MATIRDRGRFQNKIAVEYDRPSEHVLSEGELLIKNLVEKQTNTNTSLKEQLNIQKEFKKPVEFIPVTHYTCGKLTLEKFKEYSKHIDNTDELKRYGLTSSEIQLYLDSQKGNDFLQTKHKNLDKDVLLQQLNDISKKITEQNTKSEENVDRSVSRHLKDIGLSVKPDSDETKLLQFALSNVSSKPDGAPKDHPINHLKDLEGDLFGYLNREPIPSLAKRRKKLIRVENDDRNAFACTSKEKNHEKPASLWDVKELPSLNARINCDERLTNDSDQKEQEPVKKVYTCKPQQFYTIKDGKIHKLEHCNINNSEGFKIKEFQKLTEEDLRNIPRFQNYERGIPSKVLFVKNIAKSAQDDFLNLFKTYNPNDERSVTCKLLTGKMRGQAFVTFQSEQHATTALMKYNGYVLGGKPIVIQYGKSH